MKTSRNAAFLLFALAMLVAGQSGLFANYSCLSQGECECWEYDPPCPGIPTLCTAGCGFEDCEESFPGHCK